MDNDNISDNSTHSSAYQDAQGHWYSQLSSSVPSLLTSTSATTNTTTTATTMTTSLSMPLLTFTDQEYREQEIVPIQFETMCISSDDDSRNEEKHQEVMTSILSQTTTTAMASMSLSTTSHQEHGERPMAPVQSETICTSSDNDSRNEERYQEEMTSILSQEWLPPATSTPLSSAVSTNTDRSEREIENDLFHNIEQLVREFVNRPNRQYPYYRVMRWTTDDQQQIEHIVTVVINRPAIIL
jgi:hypothetical protein